MEITVGSLFSGIGGIDLAFQQVGCKIAWAIEKDSACCKTYRFNFKNMNLIQNDITMVDASKLPKVDILTAGFPCQPFSIAGKQLGFADPRGHMFYEISRFISEIRPRFVFLENVANLLEHDNGKTFLMIHNELAELEYSMRYRVLRASDYGNIPQIRDRIYIVAFKEQIDCDAFSFPEKAKSTVNIEEILSRTTKKNEIYYYKLNDPFYNTASKIVTQKDSIYRVYHDSIKITRNKMCPTLTASMGTQLNQVPLLIDNYGLRKLTLRECLDFQGFPRDYYFPNSITINDAYKQIGNSVCVSVIKRIAEKLISVVNS